MTVSRKARILLGCICLFILASIFSFKFSDLTPKIPDIHSHAQPPPADAAPKDTSSSATPSPESEDKSPKAGQPQDPDLIFKPLQESLKNARNSTLGFEKVFLINLPERADKLDSFSLAASLTGFQFEIVEGVKGSEVPDKVLPSTDFVGEGAKHRDTVVGCWRAHLNFARRMLMDGLSTALVMEDDADWDVHLKDQLSLLAEGAQYVQKTASKTRTHSPYGDDWDLIWLGHCSAAIKENDDRRFFIENDNTVAPPAHRINYGGPDEVVNTMKEGYDNHTRIIFEAQTGLCTYSYALSRRGAMKMLRAQNARKTFTPIDLGISDMCKDPKKGFRCLAVFPQLVDSHRMAGSTNKDSDIVSVNEEEKAKEAAKKGNGTEAVAAPKKPEKVREQAMTFNIVHSTRLNLDRLLRGDNVEDDPKSWSQWPDETVLDGPARTRASHRSP